MKPSQVDKVPYFLEVLISYYPKSICALGGIVGFIAFHGVFDGFIYAEILTSVGISLNLTKGPLGQVAASMAGHIWVSLDNLIFKLDSCSRSALFFDHCCMTNASLLSSGLEYLRDLVLVRLIRGVICSVICYFDSSFLVLSSVIFAFFPGCYVFELDSSAGLLIFMLARAFCRA